MKQKPFYILAILLLSIIFFGSCKKELGGKKHNLAIDSTKTGDSIVTTIVGGTYQNIVAGNSGNTYALTRHTQYNGADTIYKISAAGIKLFVYASAQSIEADTVDIHNKLSCLTADSLGNVYTISVNLSTHVQDIIKIAPGGSVSTFLGNINNQGIEKIQMDNSGTLYYYDNGGIHKVTYGGTPTTVWSGISVFTVDKADNLYFFKLDNISPAGEGNLDLVKMTPSGVTTVITGPGKGFLLNSTGQTTNFVTDITSDNKGGVFISDLYSYVNVDHWASKNYLYEVSSTGAVKTLIAGTTGHADGPLSAAKGQQIIGLSVDAAGSLYFSETNDLYSSGESGSLRKITF